MHPNRCRRQAGEDSIYCGEDKELIPLIYFVPNAQFTMTVLKPNKTPARIRSRRQEWRENHDCRAPIEELHRPAANATERRDGPRD